MINAVSANTRGAKQLAQTQNSDGDPNIVNIANGKKAGRQSAKCYGLHELANKGHSVAIFYQPVGDIAGDIQTEKRSDMGQHGDHPNSRKRDTQAFVHILWKPTQNHV